MITTPITPDLLRGVAELETTGCGLRPHRLPRWVRSRFSDPQLLAMEAQPAGARLAFRTRATRFELVTHPTRLGYRGANRPRGRIDVTVDGVLAGRDVLDGGDVTEVDLETGTTASRSGPAHSTILTGLAAAGKRVEVWLPHNESVELGALCSDAPIEPAADGRPTWLHHGSSISQGSNALGPTDIWPVVAARRSGVELRNLGLASAARSSTHSSPG